jgi:hypothetical protein
MREVIRQATMPIQSVHYAGTCRKVRKHLPTREANAPPLDFVLEISTELENSVDISDIIFGACR